MRVVGWSGSEWCVDACGWMDAIVEKEGERRSSTSSSGNSSSSGWWQ